MVRVRVRIGLGLGLGYKGFYEDPPVAWLGLGLGLVVDLPA